MHRYALNVLVTDEFDNPLTERIPGTQQPVALDSGLLFRRALLSDRTKDQQPHPQTGQLVPPVSNELKVKRFEVFAKIKAAGKRGFVDLDISDVRTLTDAIEVYGTLIHGQLRAVLNQPLATTTDAVSETLVGRPEG